ncbi:MAG: glycogen-binding domain-containing protein, partial [Candidatus Omnitrophica bacterium]|nr:glycogen-binding domain-containing protein [Candidatus Omnitrophota bacterium]
HVNVKLKEAQSQGMHVLSYDKYCRGTKDYYSLSREIISQEATGFIEDKMPVIKQKMKAIIKERMPSMKETVFSVTAPSAKEVYVAGDFNNWALNEKSRMDRDHGIWNKKIDLINGKYHYRFVIDGVWTDDPNNPKREKNPFGDTNSLIEVSAQ